MDGLYDLFKRDLKQAHEFYVLAFALAVDDNRIDDADKPRNDVSIMHTRAILTFPPDEPRIDEHMTMFESALRPNRAATFVRETRKALLSYVKNSDRVALDKKLTSGKATLLIYAYNNAKEDYKNSTDEIKDVSVIHHLLDSNSAEAIALIDAE